jgi:thiosulfate/3-mercaptopyruvate sulfurtransferase
MNDLVTADWLAPRLKDVRVVDANWYMPDDPRDAEADYLARHIPGAVHFDIDAIADSTTELPHMMPPADQFARQVGALGIGDDTMVVVYDHSGLFSAPRVWWMLKAMGHDKVAVLDGGLPAWLAGGHPVEAGRVAPEPAVFTPSPRPELIRGFDDVMAVMRDRKARMVDARSAARFRGEEAEPRAGVRGGHMPGAANVPWRSLLTAQGTLRPESELRAVFTEAGLDVRAPIVTTCGSGVSAAILMLALHRIGAPQVALYDGSWTEWGGRPEAPVERP